MPEEMKVLVRVAGVDGKTVEKLVPFDRTQFIYDAAAKQLREIVKPPAVQIAELRKQVTAQEKRIQALEKAVLRTPR